MDKKIKKITMIAILSAFIIVASKIEFRFFETRIHLGNSMCLLSAFLVSPISAGLSSGIGSMIFDLLFYQSDFSFNLFFTFVNKFLMSFICGICFNKIKNNSKNETMSIIFSAFLGEVVYIILYLLKTFFEKYIIFGLAFEVVMGNILVRLFSSSLNAIIAIIISTILYKSLKKQFLFSNE